MWKHYAYLVFHNNSWIFRSLRFSHSVLLHSCDDTSFDPFHNNTAVYVSIYSHPFLIKLKFDRIKTELIELEHLARQTKIVLFFEKLIKMFYSFVLSE